MSKKVKTKLTKDKAARVCLLVLGMHRSGTSALTRVLGMAGAKLPDKLVAPNNANETGYWEPARLQQFHDQLLLELGSDWQDWRSLDLSSVAQSRRQAFKAEIKKIIDDDYGSADLIVLKEPRICRFAPFFIETLQELGFDVRIVIALRNPMEVCDSLSKRDNMGLTYAALLWLRHALDLERASRSLPRVFISYSDFLKSWQASLNLITERLELCWPNIDMGVLEEEADKFTDDALRHHQRSTADLKNDPALAGWVDGAYRALNTLACEGMSKRTAAQLDSIDQAFNEATPILHRMQTDGYDRAQGQTSSQTQQPSAAEGENRADGIQANLQDAKTRANEVAKELTESKIQVSGLEVELARLKAERESISALRAKFEQVQNEQAHTIGRLSQENNKHKALLNIRESKLRSIESSFIQRITEPFRVRLAAIGKKFSRAQRSMPHEDLRQRVAGSGLFDADYYLEQNPGVRASNMDPLVHFIKHGGFEGRDPSELFDVSWYLSAYRDVVASGINPLVHFIDHGASEGRWCKPDPEGATVDIRPMADQHIPATITELKNACANIRFDQTAAPEISIIIPMYDQLGHTVKCLQSLAEQLSAHTFEVIIMDDCSSPENGELLRTIPGLRFYRNEKNLGFLRNCNVGFDYAEGQYIVFLNNDTVVQPGWLDALRGTFDEHDNIGLVGSKLVYPDGKLQEAGGIVWEDGSAWNWGHNQHPAHPRYNYFRDVDYVSGASIMIERSLFARLNRFDERYEPAYYEDTDLCFSVRAIGLRVAYQPKSVVFHFEGVSSGTDLNNGIKKYQTQNGKKFYAKWRDALRGNLSNGTRPDIACDRTVIGHILIIDACTPTPDQDSGSVDMFNLVKILLRLGYRVHFVPASIFAHSGAYTEALQSLGVECIFAPFYATVESYLEENAHEFSHVLLAREGVAYDWIDLVRTHCTMAKVIFYTVDLHYLREQREADLLGSAELRVQADKTKERELEVISKSDVAVVLSLTEEEELRREGKKNIAVVPLIRNIPETGEANYADRDGVLFIGGYQHKPNVDAVKWLAGEIWPAVRKLAKRQKLGEITLHLYGSKMPDEIKALEAADIKVHGFVEDLDEAFASARLSVAPLKYGAGLKGKVATSYGLGVPVVGTSIAFEGMPGDGAQSPFAIADTPEEFARVLIDLYQNEEKWLECSDACREYVVNHYSIEAITPKIEELLK